MASAPDRESRVVVCAIEGSDIDENAVEIAAQLAILTKARLALLAVAPVPPASARERGLPTWTPAEAMRALERTTVGLLGRVDVDYYLEAGNPVRRLVEFAARKRALLLVVGMDSPASSSPASIAASSVSRIAPCPVVVVPGRTALPRLQMSD